MLSPLIDGCINNALLHSFMHAHSQMLSPLIDGCISNALLHSCTHTHRCFLHSLMAASVTLCCIHSCMHTHRCFFHWQLIFSVTSYWTSELPNHASSHDWHKGSEQAQPQHPHHLRTIQGHWLLLVLSSVWFRIVRYTVCVLVCVASVVITSSFKLKLQIHFSRRNKILC